AVVVRVLLAPARAAVGERRPDAGHLVRVVGEVGAPVLGEPEGTTSALVVPLDQSLVLELADRRVDRAGARAPGAAGALADLLDHLVAVQRTVGEQRQDRPPHVAASCPRAPRLLLGGEPEQPGQPRRRAGTPARWAPATPRSAPLTAVPAAPVTLAVRAAVLLEHRLELASPVPVPHRCRSFTRFHPPTVVGRSRYIATVRDGAARDKRFLGPDGAPTVTP